MRSRPRGVTAIDSAPTSTSPSAASGASASSSVAKYFPKFDAMRSGDRVPPGKRVTLGGDKNYDTREFVRELRGMNITPHVAQNTTNRRSAVDERTTRHAGYEVSQRKRKRVEQSFGWMKMIGMLKKVKLRGIEKVGWLFTFTGAAYNLCRLRNLMARI